MSLSKMNATRGASLLVGLAASFSVLPAAVPALIASGSPAPAISEAKLRQTAERLHARSILVDGHNDITMYMTDAGYDLAEPSEGLFHTDLARMKRGGVGAQFFSVWIDPDKYATNGGATRALKIIDAVYRAVASHPDQLAMATTVSDIRSAKRQGRIAALLGIEGGYAIEDSLENLRAFYRLGVRYMTLTHRIPTSWAGAATNGPGLGLTPFGRDVVREMNRLGMLVDVSHVSDATMSDVLDVAQAPVIASHSSARALCPVPRNIPDSLLRRIATNGGVVMVNFYNGFLDTNYAVATAKIKTETDAIWKRYDKDLRGLRKAEAAATASLPRVPLACLADHIDHIARVAGIDHVGLGSDFDGVQRTPTGMEDVTCFPNLTVELLRRGYAPEDIRKILGENLLRVMSAAEQVARGASASGAKSKSHR
jgi:membrane dipeptidase